MTACLHCALRALVNGEPAPVFPESPEEHVRLAHPDPVATARERRELEAAVARLVPPSGRYTTLRDLDAGVYQISDEVGTRPAAKKMPET